MIITILSKSKKQNLVIVNLKSQLLTTYASSNKLLIFCTTGIQHPFITCAVFYFLSFKMRDPQSVYIWSSFLDRKEMRKRETMRSHVAVVFFFRLLSLTFSFVIRCCMQNNLSTWLGCCCQNRKNPFFCYHTT